MFPYQPNQQNTSGQIYADLALQGAKGLAGGISQAGQSIGADLEQLNQIRRQQEMASGAAQAAQGAYNNQPISMEDLNAMTPLQRMGASAAMTQMYPAMVRNNYYNEMMNYRNANHGQDGGGGSPQLLTVP